MRYVKLPQYAQDQYEKYHDPNIPVLKRRVLEQLTPAELARLDAALIEGVSVRNLMDRFNVHTAALTIRRKQLGLTKQGASS